MSFNDTAVCLPFLWALRLSLLVFPAGAEALFADLGHFSMRSIQVSKSASTGNSIASALQQDVTHQMQHLRRGASACTRKGKCKICLLDAAPCTSS